MLCICYSANGDLVTVLTSGIYKHMKRAATELFKRQSKNRAFFQNYFDLRQNRGAKTRPLGQLKCANPRGSPGGWSGLELTDI